MCGKDMDEARGGRLVEEDVGLVGKTAAESADFGRGDVVKSSQRRGGGRV